MITAADTMREWAVAPDAVARDIRAVLTRHACARCGTPAVVQVETRDGRRIERALPRCTCHPAAPPAPPPPARVTPSPAVAAPRRAPVAAPRRAPVAPRPGAPRDWVATPIRLGGS